MKSSRLFLACVIVTLSLLFTSTIVPAHATTKKKAPKPVDTRTLVKSVNLSDDTVILESARNNALHTYHIDSATTVTVSGVPGKTISDIRSGMEVRSSVERDDQTLDAIYVDTADYLPGKKKK
jgi:D-hexose-6-phosphate mutarotase